jgi:hypothetical protein
MDIDDDDRRDAHRILSAALDDPEEISDRHLDRALDLLASDANRVRVGAAWVFGIVATETPDRALSYLPRIAALLDGSETRSEAARAIAYLADAAPGGIERELRSMDGDLARRCRQALWGELAERTVVGVPDDEDTDTGATMGRGESDEWGWIGGGRAAAHVAGSEPDRSRPPEDRPVDPPTVDYDYDRFTPVGTIHRGDAASSFEVIYRTPDGETTPGIFKRFSPPEDGELRTTFDRRVGMWRSIDGHEAILPVVDWGIEPAPWVVTAYEDADGLADLGRNDRLSAAVWTLRRVADALRFAHARGVIHGGLTPGAIVRSSILTEPDAWRFPRVTDWGYVDLLRSDTDTVPLPERYLAPEHDGGTGDVDGATDVYGFGLLAYEALVGRVPSGSDRPVPADPGPGSVPVPDALDRRLPDLEGVLRRCLAERKAERFETIEAMAAAFRAATEGVDG